MLFFYILHFEFYILTACTILRNHNPLTGFHRLVNCLEDLYILPAHFTGHGRWAVLFYGKRKIIHLLCLLVDLRELHFTIGGFAF
jgi:hypothetical protein